MADKPTGQEIYLFVQDHYVTLLDAVEKEYGSVPGVRVEALVPVEPESEEVCRVVLSNFPGDDVALGLDKQPVM